MIEFFSIDNLFFTIYGQGVSWIEAFSVVSGLTCVFLATRTKVANFWIGYLYNILLFVLFYQKGLYSSMLIQPVSFIINFFGHYRWTHPKAGEENRQHQLKVTLLSDMKRILHICLLFVFAITWGLFMKLLPNLCPDIFQEPVRPYLDAFVTGAILTAQYFSAQKKLECWSAWLIVNLTNITLYILAGMAFLPMVSVGYLILAFFGFSTWLKQWKSNN